MLCINNMEKDKIKKGLDFLSEIGWTELIDSRWTNDVKSDLLNSNLNLTEEEIVKICEIVIYPEPDWNSKESCYK